MFLAPEFRSARYQLALALHLEGDHDHAIREYQACARCTTPDELRARLAASSRLLRDAFWNNEDFLGALCEQNRERARQKLPPVV